MMGAVPGQALSQPDPPSTIRTEARADELRAPPPVLGRPFALVVAYGAFGAFFMPFLAGTLLWLLNSRRTPARWRNGWLSNTLLAAAATLFVVLCVNEIAGLFQ